jgi:hypothetical protein
MIRHCSPVRNLPTFRKKVGPFFGVEGKVYSSILKIERRWLSTASAGFLLGLLFDPEDGFDVLLRNVELFPN